jgi:hypothetical protein
MRQVFAARVVHHFTRNTHRQISHRLRAARNHITACDGVRAVLRRRRPTFFSAAAPRELTAPRLCDTHAYTTKALRRVCVMVSLTALFLKRKCIVQ